MNTVIKTMMSKYNINTVNDEINSVKEIIQEIVLLGLSRGGFFDEAAFYGGTALRIFYGLDRFSEDLDFALLKPNKNFDLTKYFNAIEDELKKYGFNLTIKNKVKTKESNIDSAFLKGDTKEIILSCFPKESLKEDGKYKDIKIKFEVDINPPDGANFEVKTKVDPNIHYVKLYDMPSLYAGKVHAILCRNWKMRVKGRDLYDFIFYLQSKTKINMELLKNKLIASEALKEKDKFDIDVLKKMLKKKFNEIDFNEAKQDVIKFLHDDNDMPYMWDKKTFCDLVDLIK
ncbi:MAG: nucleotidyl transferase AbiEii/AbiGii toxin family protein [Clostridia bacterium]|nr:nucleotidyl transferase AbiEii/AbiGii toxin family protein [Clostridia bacterium]